ncbi:IS110 family transposase [Faecalicatena contorta]|uniref:Transposase n=1 Tax=Faecalicatena contorta TaxID=39482 RepID=A0A316AJK7_9FIRM|nr:IS110 family transposase [Faecalicatena contorta]PWJ50147.1 transposase [Faecalicatena contorta]SUQ14268.1 Transposase [Faecalicatena contorta]
MIAVGVDVSKHKSTVAVISSDGEIRMKPTDFHHDQPTLNQLVSTLLSFHDDVKIVMEATGHYHKPILKIFLESNLFVSVVNPYIIKKYSENDIRKGKTDKKDAMRIAWYVLEKHYSIVPYNITDQKYDDLKYLSRQYGQCVSMRVKARVQLYNLLDNIMPGIQTIINSRTADPDDRFT